MRHLPQSLVRRDGTLDEALPSHLNIAIANRITRDIRYAIRQLRKSPGYAIAAILTLSLAIGVNTAIFTLVHAILLRELPFREPSRVLSVDHADTVGLDFHMGAKSFTAAFNDAAGSFQTIDAASMYATGGVNDTFSADSGSQVTAKRMQVAETSAQFLNVLGITPILGRGFAQDEDFPGKDQVALISDAVWRSEMHADPGTLGKSILINGKKFTIIGVLPPRLDFPAHTSLFTPTIFDEHASLREGGAFFSYVLVRARQDLGIDALRAEFSAKAAAAHPPKGKTNGINADDQPILTPIASELTKSVRFSLLMLTVAVSFVLLIACANVASLALVRTARRRGEFAVRAALGASGGRLIQQQMAESLLVALASGILGILIAYAALDLIYLIRPVALLEFTRPAIDPAVLAFTAALALFTGVLFGIIPAFLAGREDPAEALKSGVWRTSPRSSRFRRYLITGEITIAFILLTAAGLMLRTMANMDKVSLGYDTTGVLTFSVSLHGAPYEWKETSNPAIQAFYTRVLDSLNAIHSVTIAAAVSALPLDRRAEMLLPLKAGDQTSPSTVPAAPRISSSGYFAALGIPLIEGRDFTAHDTRTSQRVAIITQDVARKLFPNQSALGHQLACSWYCTPSPIIIGVAAASRRFGPRREQLAEYFLPYTQQDSEFMTFVLRTRGNPELVIPAARTTLVSTDPTQPLYDITTMQQRLDDNESLIRFELFTLVLFAALATLLVSIGLYGVISSSVTQQTREIGIRLALGAQRKTILLTFVRESSLIALMGTTLGLAASLALTRLLASVLFGVAAHDPGTLAAVFLLFVALALAASFPPAFRGASINPAETLRSE